MSATPPSIVVDLFEFMSLTAVLTDSSGTACVGSVQPYDIAGRILKIEIPRMGREALRPTDVFKK